MSLKFNKTDLEKKIRSSMEDILQVTLPLEDAARVRKETSAKPLSQKQLKDKQIRQKSAVFDKTEKVALWMQENMPGFFPDDSAEIAAYLHTAARTQSLAERIGTLDKDARDKWHENSDEILKAKQIFVDSAKLETAVKADQLFAESARQAGLNDGQIEISIALMNHPKHRIF